MVKIQIDIPKDQNERFEMLNKQMALSKAKTIVLLLKEIFKLPKSDFEDLVLGRTTLKTEQYLNIISNSETHTTDYSGYETIFNTTKINSDYKQPHNMIITYSDGTTDEHINIKNNNNTKEVNPQEVNE